MNFYRTDSKRGPHTLRHWPTQYQLALTVACNAATSFDKPRTDALGRFTVRSVGRRVFMTHSDTPDTRLLILRIWRQRVRGLVGQQQPDIVGDVLGVKRGGEDHTSAALTVYQENRGRVDHQVPRILAQRIAGASIADAWVRCIV